MRAIRLDRNARVSDPLPCRGSIIHYFARGRISRMGVLLTSTMSPIYRQFLDTVARGRKCIVARFVGAGRGARANANLIL